MNLLAGIALWGSIAPLARGHGQLHEQIHAISTEIASKPKDARLYLRRAELRRLHREEKDAASDYDAAERLDPAIVEVHLGRGKLLFEFGKLEEARAALDRFLGIKPYHIDGLMTRARVEIKLGRPLVAAADFSKVLQLSSKPEPEHYLECAKALASAGPEHVPAALNVIERGITRLGDLPTLNLLAIDIEAGKGDYEAAIARVDRLLASSGRKEVWLERKGDLLRKAGRLDEAQVSYMAALEALKHLPPHVASRRAVIDLKDRLAEKSAAGQPCR